MALFRYIGSLKEWKLYLFISFLLVLSSVIKCNLFVDPYIRTEWILMSFILLIFLLIIAVNWIRDKRIPFDTIYQLLLFAVLTITFLYSIWGIIERIIQLYYDINTVRICSFDNEFGYAFFITCGISVLYHFREQNIIGKRSFVLLLVLYMFAIILSKSRISLFSCLCMLCYAYFIKCYKKHLLIVTLTLLILLVILFLLWSFNTDSINGRFLIWRGCFEMIKEKPFFGWGVNGFRANYMNYQSLLLESINNKSLSMLVSNVDHPFNEFLLIAVNYGAVGFLCVIITSFYIIKRIGTLEVTIKLPQVLFLINLLLSSLTSYPFRYPITLLLLIVCLFSLFVSTSNRFIRSIFVKMKNYKTTCLALLSVVLLVSIFNIYNELLWKYAYRRYTKTDVYCEKIYDYLSRVKPLDNYFLYNKAAILCKEKRFNESLLYCNELKKHWADYELMLLMGDTYMGLKNMRESEYYYNKAVKMCPNRLLPEFKLFLLYQDEKMYDKMQYQANIVLTKPIKIENQSVYNMRKFVERSLK